MQSAVCRLTGPSRAPRMGAMSLLLEESAVRRLRACALPRRGDALSGAAGDVAGKGKGGNVEFREHRPYAPGDELRYVDWNAYARTGQLHVKEFSREQERRVVLRVDASASMASGDPPKGLVALRIAAAIGVAALANGCRVRAAAFSAGMAREGGEHVGALGEAELLRELSAVPSPVGPTGLGASLRPLLEPGMPRAEVYLVTDLLDPVDARREVAALCERGCEVTVVATWCEADLHPPTGGILRIRDAESGEERLVSLGAAEREAYEAAMRGFEEDWAGFLARHGARLVPVRTEAPIATILFEELKRHGVVV